MVWRAAVLVMAVLLAGCGGPAKAPCIEDPWPTLPGATVITVCPAGFARHAIVELPSAATDGLVLALHGAGGSGAQVRGYAGLSDQSVQSRFAVIYPQGLPQLDGTRLGVWNGAHCCGKPWENGTDDVGFLAHLVAKAQDAGVAGPVVAVGHSNGGIMAHRFAAERSDLVDGVVAVAATVGGQEPGGGSLLLPGEPEHPVSVAVIHARDDPVVPFDGGPAEDAPWSPSHVSVNETVQFWLRAAGDPPQTASWVRDGVAFTTWNGTEAFVWQIVTTGGHGWPSAEAQEPPKAPETSQIVALVVRTLR